MISNGEAVWRQKNGKRVFVGEMAKEHLINAIKTQEAAWAERYPCKLVIPEAGETREQALMREVGGFRPDVIPLYQELLKRGLQYDTALTVLESFRTQDVWQAAPLVSLKLGRDINRCGYCTSARISVTLSSDVERVHCNDCSLEVVGADGIEVWNRLKLTRAEEIFSCS